MQSTKNMSLNREVVLHTLMKAQDQSLGCVFDWVQGPVVIDTAKMLWTIALTGVFINY